MTRREARDKALAAIDRLAKWTRAEPHKRGIALARSAVGRAFDEVRQPYSAKRVRSELEAEAALGRMAAEVCGPFNPAKALEIGAEVLWNPLPKKAEKATRSA